jgi:hypothetical protein
MMATPAPDEPFLSLQTQCQPRIHDPTVGRPNPEAFLLSTYEVNSLLWERPALTVFRLNTCGFIVRSGIVLVLPTILAHFFSVSERFVRDHLNSIDRVDRLDRPQRPPHRPRKPLIQGIFAT